MEEIAAGTATIQVIHGDTVSEWGIRLLRVCEFDVVITTACVGVESAPRERFQPGLVWLGWRSSQNIASRSGFDACSRPEIRKQASWKTCDVLDHGVVYDGGSESLFRGQFSPP